MKRLQRKLPKHQSYSFNNLATAIHCNPQERRTNVLLLSILCWYYETTRTNKCARVYFDGVMLSEYVGTGKLLISDKQKMVKQLIMDK